MRKRNIWETGKSLVLLFWSLLPSPSGGGNNARDARAARRAAREQAGQQEGGYWGDWT